MRSDCNRQAGSRMNHKHEVSRPLISIITVCKNAGKKLSRTFESVLRQDYSALEYIVVDGLSGDETCSIIETYGHAIDGLICEEDSGIYDAMNKGIAQASGDYILFMNAGDEFHDDHSVSNLARAAAATGADVVAGQTIELDKDGRYVRRLRNYIDISCFFTGIPVCHQAMLYRRKLHKDLGMYDTRYKIVADYDFELKCVMSGKVFTEIEQFTAYFYNDGISQTNLSHHHQEAFEVKHKYFPFVDNVDIQLLGAPYMIASPDIEHYQKKYNSLSPLFDNAVIAWKRQRKSPPIVCKTSHYDGDIWDFIGTNYGPRASGSNFEISWSESKNASAPAKKMVNLGRGMPMTCARCYAEYEGQNLTGVLEFVTDRHAHLDAIIRSTDSRDHVFAQQSFLAHQGRPYKLHYSLSTLYHQPLFVDIISPYCECTLAILSHETLVPDHLSSTTQGDIFPANRIDLPTEKEKNLYNDKRQKRDGFDRSMNEHSTWIKLYI